MKINERLKEIFSNKGWLLLPTFTLIIDNPSIDLCIWVIALITWPFAISNIYKNEKNIKVNK